MRLKEDFCAGGGVGQLPAEWLNAVAAVLNDLMVRGGRLIRDGWRWTLIVQEGWNGKARTPDGKDYDGLLSDGTKGYIKYDAITNAFTQETGPMPTGGTMATHEIWWKKSDIGPGTITLWRI